MQPQKCYRPDSWTTHSCWVSIYVWAYPALKVQSPRKSKVQSTGQARVLSPVKKIQKLTVEATDCWSYGLLATSGFLHHHFNSCQSTPFSPICQPDIQTYRQTDRPTDRCWKEQYICQSIPSLLQSTTTSAILLHTSTSSLCWYRWKILFSRTYLHKTYRNWSLPSAVSASENNLMMSNVWLANSLWTKNKQQQLLVVHKHTTKDNNNEREDESWLRLSR